MTKKIKSLFLVFISIFLFFHSPKNVKAEEFSIKIFHTNDLYAEIENMGKIAQFINTEKENAHHSLYLNTGNILSQKYEEDLTEGSSTIQLLNHMKLDLLTINPNEFTHKKEVLQKRKSEANFDWLAANIKNNNSNNSNIDLKPYKIFEVEGQKIGVLGITSTAEWKNFEFISNEKTIKQYQKLRDDVDILIALTHVGIENNRQIAKQFDIFDLIIGGKSEFTSTTPEIIDGTPIVHTNGHGQDINIIDLKMNTETKEIVTKNHHQKVAELTEVDEDIQNKVDQYVKENKDKLQEIIGKTKTKLNAEGRWTKDVAIGNLITDALREYTATDIAFIDNQLIDGNINKGEITYQDLLKIIPENQSVSTFNMKGKDIKKLLIYSYHRDLKTKGARVYLQTSGLNYVIYTDKDKINNVDADLFIKNEKIKAEKTYSITANACFVEEILRNDKLIVENVQTNKGKIPSTVAQYIQKITTQKGELAYEAIEGRISVQSISEKLTQAEKYPPLLNTDEIIIDLNKDNAQLPTPKSLISEENDLPDDVKVSFVNKEKIDLSGENTGKQVLKIRFLYADGSESELPISVIVIPVKENVDANKEEQEENKDGRREEENLPTDKKEIDEEENLKIAPLDSDGAAKAIFILGGSLFVFFNQLRKAGKNLLE